MLDEEGLGLWGGGDVHHYSDPGRVVRNQVLSEVAQVAPAVLCPVAVSVLELQMDVGLLAFALVVGLGGFFDGSLPRLDGHELLALLVILAKLVIVLFLLLGRLLLHSVLIHWDIDIIDRFSLIPILCFLSFLFFLLLLRNNLLGLVGRPDHIPQQNGPIVPSRRNQVILVVTEPYTGDVGGMPVELFVGLALDYGWVFV